jgi:hypothetical protein
MLQARWKNAGFLSETAFTDNVRRLSRRKSGSRRAFHRVGKKLEWDGPNMKATNSSEAAQYVKREYRKGWTLG